MSRLRFASFLLLHAAAARAADPPPSYWWRFPGSDCDSCDAGLGPPPPSLPSSADCPPARSIANGSAWGPYCVGAFQAACANTTGCAGFNADRIFKNASCAARVGALNPATEGNIDLYVLGDTPLPPPVPTAHPDIWPRPSGLASVGHGTAALATDFSFVPGSEAAGCAPASPLLIKVLARYSALLRPPPPTNANADAAAAAAAPAPAPAPASPPLRSISVCVRSADETLGRGTNESYSLHIDGTSTASSTSTTTTTTTTTSTTTNATNAVDAETVFGAMRALETVASRASLSRVAGTYSNGTLGGLPLIIPSDAPRFPYRGLMIDTGRHFLPVPFLKRVVERLAMHKLNVLHWHLVDAQSFACGSDAFPALAQKGAYDAARAVYSTADLRAVVQHGREHGVRVVPEWDMPGHGHWGAGEPGIMVGGNPRSAVMDVTKPALYGFLRAFLGEMSTIFTDELLFLGGDEVDTAAWTADPAIVAWLKAHGMTADDLQPYFWQQVRATVLPALTVNKTLGVWENDAFQVDPASLPPGAVVNVYQSLKTVAKALQLNLSTTVSLAGSHWYLDSQCGGYNQNAWKCVYNVDPGSATAGLPAHQAALLLGGEVAMWGEGVNQDNFDAYVWRGAAAAAERLWSRPDQTAAADDSTEQRLAAHACRLAKRGVRMGPVGAGFCPSDADVQPPDSSPAAVAGQLAASERIELEMLRDVVRQQQQQQQQQLALKSL